MLVIAQALAVQWIARVSRRLPSDSLSIVSLRKEEAFRTRKVAV